MKQNKKIAITGGIGSGKSTVAKIIAGKGYPVISCDEVYADLLKNRNFLKVICDNFGDVLTENGELDRAKLSKVVFGDKEKLTLLNNITHPRIYAEAFNRGEQSGGACFYEVPLLFESGGESKFDDVIIVMRDLDKRIAAIQKRDNLSEEAVKKRIKSQYDYDNCDFTRYYVIHNNYNFDKLNEQIDEVLKKIL